MSRDGDNEVNDNPNDVENSREFGLMMAIKDIKSQNLRGGGLNSGHDLIVSKKRKASVDTAILQRTC